jgi:uncharacterized SAM-binding protein YcdF (DUF218 family)
MFFVLSKVLNFFLVPLNWVWPWFWLAWRAKTPRARRRWLGLGVGLLYLLSLKGPVNQLMLWWELPPTPFASVPAGRYPVAVVLSGSTTDRKSPRDRLYYNRSADRMLYALRLYHEGKVGKILISGVEYSNVLTLPDSSQVRSTAETALMCAVPPQDIWVEARSLNTHQNAVNSAQVLRREFPGQPCLVVSSAFHLRRALACFRRQGLVAEGFGADYHGLDPDSSLGFWLLPNLEALQDWQVLAKEWIGYVTYQAQGYL